ncbi:MAG TPA: GMC family oxidoreductase, partial [Candidatus Baltobacteraceae bacterium]
EELMLVPCKVIRFNEAMIIDFRSFPDGAEIEADLCIVGSGPAGIALAAEFLDSPLRVLLCESGGPQLDAANDELSDGEIVGHPSQGLREGRARAFGGTSRLWAGQCIELDDIDFEDRPWVPYSGWPITKTVLAPYYQRAEHVFGLRDELYDKRIWQSFGVPTPELDARQVGVKFTIFAPIVNLGPHVRRRFEASRNVRTLLHATVTKLRTEEGTSIVRQALLRSFAGNSATVRARAFAVCCGGIETARLLLLSNDQERGGLGNRRGLVGRFLQDHPNGYTAEVTTADPKRLQDTFNLFYRDRKKYFAKLPLSADVQRKTGALNCTAHLVYDYPDDSGIGAARALVRALRKRKAAPPGTLRRLSSAPAAVWSTATRRYLRGFSPTGTPTAIRLKCHMEQAPNPDSRVLLSDRRDRFNQPRVQLDWRLNELELHTARVLTECIASEFARLGLGTVNPAPWLRSDHWSDELFDAYHHIGTTRMSLTPEDGVVDTDLRVHDLQGLFVASSAVFPTSGYANPTLSIVALALRLADHLKLVLSDAPTPSLSHATISK